MATQVFDTLQQASFAGFPFPVSRTEVVGALRDHVHEYPHTPGGAPEKLGRKLYEFHFTVPLYQGQPKYPKNFPETMQSLLIIFEGGQSFDLVVPILGTITAYCTAWKVTADPKTGRNGVLMDLTFREDQSTLFLVTELIAQTTQSFNSALASYNTALADQQGRLAAALTTIQSPDPLMLAQIPTGELFQFLAIASAASSLIAEIEAAVTYGAAVAGLAEAVVALCQGADATCSSLQDPTRYELLYAMQALWAQAQQIAVDALQTQIQIVSYTVPQPGLGVAAISTAIYGDTSHAIELMQVNGNLEDPFLVAGGTVLRAFLTAPAQLAA